MCRPTASMKANQGIASPNASLRRGVRVAGSIVRSNGRAERSRASVAGASVGYPFHRGSSAPPSRVSRSAPAGVRSHPDQELLCACGLGAARGARAHARSAPLGPRADRIAPGVQPLPTLPKLTGARPHPIEATADHDRTEEWERSVSINPSRCSNRRTRMHHRERLHATESGAQDLLSRTTRVALDSSPSFPL